MAGTSPAMTSRIGWGVHLNSARALVLKSEIARRHTLIGRDVFCWSAQDEFAELHHIGAVGGLQRGLRVRSDQQHRPPAPPQPATGAENIGHHGWAHPKTCSR